MPLRRPAATLRRWLSGLPSLAGYGLAAVFVAAGLGARYLASYLDWPGPTAMLFLIYSIGGAAMLKPSMGYFATVLASITILPSIPTGHAGWIEPEWITPLVVFMGLGFGLTALIDSFTAALADREAATRRWALLLIEYRHRTRGDLQAISSLLRLRMRYVQDPAGKAALAEAAGHTVALGRIHTRLEQAQHDADDVAVIDAGGFVVGVCADMMPPVREARGVEQTITSDRAVALGLLVCEMIAEARLDGATRIAVSLIVIGPHFYLDVTDDRPQRGTADSMRTRLITLLAGQLRGTVSIAQNVASVGWLATAKFPVLAPVLTPGSVGA